jgi:hypothetical protein
MKRLFTSLLVLAFASLGGCANVSSSYKLDPTKGNGLIVGTITYTSYGGEYYVTAIRAADPKTTVRLSVGSAMWHPFAKVNDDELKMKGDTFAVEAAAGEYTLGKWFIKKGNMWYSSDRPIGISFKVEPGKATYIGNIHYVEKDSVNLQDMAQRDIPILQARFEAVKATPVSLKIAEGTKLEGLGGTSTRTINFTPIFIPVAPR